MSRLAAERKTSVCDFGKWGTVDYFRRVAPPKKMLLDPPLADIIASPMVKTLGGIWRFGLSPRRLASSKCHAPPIVGELHAVILLKIELSWEAPNPNKIKSRESASNSTRYGLHNTNLSLFCPLYKKIGLMSGNSVQTSMRVLLFNQHYWPLKGNESILIRGLKIRWTHWWGTNTLQASWFLVSMPFL